MHTLTHTHTHVRAHASLPGLRRNHTPNVGVTHQLSNADCPASSSSTTPGCDDEDSPDDIRMRYELAAQDSAVLSRQLTAMKTRNDTLTHELDAMVVLGAC